MRLLIAFTLLFCVQSFALFAKAIDTNSIEEKVVSNNITKKYDCKNEREDIDGKLSSRSNKQINRNAKNQQPSHNNIFTNELFSMSNLSAIEHSFELVDNFSHFFIFSSLYPKHNFL